MKSWLCHGIAMLALACSLSADAASYVYRYVGDPFPANGIIDANPPTGSFTTEMFVELHVEFADLVAANRPYSFIADEILDFRIADGRREITKTNATTFGFLLATNALGEISEWFFIATRQGQVVTALGDIGGDIATTFLPSQSRIGDGSFYFECIAITPSGCNNALDRASSFTPGVWSVSAIPEPARYAMFLAGIVLLVVVARRRQLR